MPKVTPVRLKNLAFNDVARMLQEMGEPRFRAKQVLNWVYRKRLDAFEDMTNVSKASRQQLSERFSIDKLQCDGTLVSSRGDAAKFAWRLVESDDTVESVLLYDRQRRTACVSSQLGCGLGCTFCATGTMGLVRNLALDEVTGQLIGLNDYLVAQGDKTLTHVVFMGMGEALANFDVFCAACEVIHAEEGLGLAYRRITVSTAGVVPAIDRLIREGPPVNLAISLNTFSDELRSRYMPVNDRYPIAEVIAAGRRFVEASERTLTFEYVVNHGENDTPQAVESLAAILRGIRCKVNCIPLNPTSTGVGASPDHDTVLRFVQALHQRGVTATARRSRGRDIDGACGQLCTRPSGRPHTPPVE